MKNIVTIGGGNGSPVINEALLRSGKVKFIDTITAVFDTGGATGRRRTDSRGQELAYSDPMRNMLSLANPKQRQTPQYKALVKLMTSRSWGKVLGQEIFAHFHKDGDGFDNVQNQLSELTGIKFLGRVIPSTTCSTNIVFKTKSGRIYTGENQLDDHSMSKDTIEKMWLEKKCNAYEEAVKAIKNASIVIFSCGSLHGSVLCNLLPKGIKEALKSSKARIYAITNLVSTRNETNNYTPFDFVNIIREYSDISPTALIVPAISRTKFEAKFPEVANLYQLDNSHFLGWEEEELVRFTKTSGVKVIKHHATKIIETKENEKTIRHDPIKLAKTFKEIL